MPLLALSERVRFMNGPDRADQNSQADGVAGVRW